MDEKINEQKAMEAAKTIQQYCTHKTSTDCWNGNCVFSYNGKCRLQKGLAPQHWFTNLNE